jgi:hypothetical protein
MCRLPERFGSALCRIYCICAAVFISRSGGRDTGQQSGTWTVTSVLKERVVASVAGRISADHRGAVGHRHLAGLGPFFHVPPFRRIAMATALTSVGDDLLDIPANPAWRSRRLLACVTQTVRCRPTTDVVGTSFAICGDTAASDVSFMPRKWSMRMRVVGIAAIVPHIARSTALYCAKSSRIGSPRGVFCKA